MWVWGEEEEGGTGDTELFRSSPLVLMRPGAMGYAQITSDKEG